MQEIKPKLVGESSMIGGFCTDMYRKVDRNNPVMGHFNGVRIIMFVEDREHTPVDKDESSTEQYKRNEP